MVVQCWAHVAVQLLLVWRAQQGIMHLECVVCVLYHSVLFVFFTIASFVRVGKPAL